MPANDVKPKVLEWLNSFYNGVEELESGALFVPGFGSTALFVWVEDVFDNEYVRVRIDAPVLIEVPVNSELLNYIGIKSNDFLFGGFALMQVEGERTAALVFRQTLLGDALDSVELELATKVVAITADQLDNDLQLRFGGRVFG
jgi:hypothetical protein